MLFYSVLNVKRICLNTAVTSTCIPYKQINRDLVDPNPNWRPFRVVMSLGRNTLVNIYSK